MRKNPSLLLICLVLSGCAAHQLQPVAQCDSIGIDIERPDFYQKHKLADINKFYTCTESQVKAESYNEYKSNVFQAMALGFKGINPAAAASQKGEKAAEALEYQRNLWRQVINREKKPGAAYEMWVQWVQNERNIAATNQAAASATAAANAANDAATASQQQNMQLQQIQQQQFIQMNGR